MTAIPERGGRIGVASATLPPNLQGKGHGMKRLLGIVVLMAGTLLVVSLAAFAALPKNGATYEGTIKSSPFPMKINIGVSKDGKKLQHFTYFCGTGRAPTIVFGIPIDRTGRFTYTKKTGSVVVWKMAGHFVSASKAFISLNSVACGGSKGSATITLKV